MIRFANPTPNVNKQCVNWKFYRNTMYLCDLMLVAFSHPFGYLSDLNLANGTKDPAVQQATGETDPIGVIGKLREMKNSFK